MEIARKLVRGLKDVSPLFDPSQNEISIRQTPELQVLGVSSPEDNGDSLFLNTFFASRIASADRPCSLVTLLSRHTPSSANLKKEPEAFGSHLQRHWLFWDELKGLLTPSLSVPAPRPLQNRNIFLDFEYRHLFYYEPAVSLLDKWILLLKPTIESLTEGYKMMKGSLALNPHLQFFITLEGKATEDQGAGLFERFSEFIFKHLGIHIGWLGWLDLSDTERHFLAVMDTGQLLFQHGNSRLSLGKFALAGWIDSLQEQNEHAAFAEALR